MPQNRKRDAAAQTLVEYIKLATEHGPNYLQLNSDSCQQVEGIVDLIIEAAVDRLAERGQTKALQLALLNIARLDRAVSDLQRRMIP